MVASAYPALPYFPPWWLRSGHTNTIYSYLRPRGVRLPAAEDHWVESQPGVRLLLRCHWRRQPAPALVLCHGLEGSSEAGYMQTLAERALALGWHAIRMNVRNCGDSEGHSRTVYNSGLSGDIAAVLNWVAERPGVERLALCGFSMSGNTVLKYAGELAHGEWRHNWTLSAIVAVSPCLDLAACADALHRRANWLYERRFLRGLNARIRRYASVCTPALDLSPLAEVDSVRAFDDVFTAPLMGYRDADDYYERASAARVLADIHVPTLILHAEDDPFIVITEASRRLMAGNPHILFLAQPHGGHCAFINARNRYESVYWAENRVAEFCGDQFWAAAQREFKHAAPSLG